MTIWISRELPLFIFERLVLSWASHIHLSQKSWPFEYARPYIVNFKRLDILCAEIGDPSEILCSIFRVPIYYEPKSDILVKSYDHLNFSRAFVVHFLASWYIMGLTHTPEWKVMAVWICRELLCLILSVSIYFATQSNIRVKCYDDLNFSRASVVHFREARYLMGLTHTAE